MSDLRAVLAEAATSMTFFGSTVGLLIRGRHRSHCWRSIPGAAAATIAFALSCAAQELKAPANASPPVPHTPKVGVQSAPMRVEVLDGVTFRDVESGAVYRLFGVDACAFDQRATQGRQSWPCGAVATSWLVTATLGKWIACSDEYESDSVASVRCATAEHPDLGLDLLRAGLGVALTDDHGRKLRAYAEGEAQARKAMRGLWASQFELPRVYRETHAISPTRALPQATP